MKRKKLVWKVRDNIEFRAYVIWGVISSLLNVILFHILTLSGIEYRISNIITLIIVRVFCYLTNKFFVFKTRTDGVVSLLKEIGSFLLARTVTFFMDYYGVVILVEVLRVDTLMSKIISAILVIICNYVFSKFFVFKNNKGGSTG